MLKKYIYFTFIYVSIAILVSSCIGEERMEISPKNSDPTIVIYGFLTDSLMYHEIKISSTVPYFSKEPNPVVSGAEVKLISSEKEVFDFTESESLKGSYFTKEKICGKSGILYTLHVEIDFNNDGVKEVYTAQSLLQSSVPIDSIVMEPYKISESIFGEKIEYNFYMGHGYWNDPEGKDFYLYKIYLNDSLLSNDLSQYYLYSDFLRDDTYVDKELLFSLDNESNRENYSEKELKNIVFAKPGDIVRVEFSKIEEGYYNFILQSNEEKTGQINGGYAANITSNITNGGKGYFSTYSISKKEIIIE